MIKRTQGFTLVEVMIVVVAISILSAIAIPNLLRARLESHKALAQSTLKTISGALETYAGAQSYYPPNTTVLINAIPPYLSVDYFSGIHNGYTFTTSLTPISYSATAIPSSPSFGTGSYTITTGGVLVKN